MMNFSNKGGAMVKRYTVPEYSVLYEKEDGLLVEYKDYTALQAENERLKAESLLRDQREGSGESFWGPLPKAGGPDWTGYGG